MTAQELLKRIESKTAPVIIDARTGIEFKGGHIQGAIHAPFLKILLKRARLPEDKNSELVITCEHGPRAQLEALRASARHISAAISPSAANTAVDAPMARCEVGSRKRSSALPAPAARRMVAQATRHLCMAVFVSPVYGCVWSRVTYVWMRWTCVGGG